MSNPKPQPGSQLLPGQFFGKVIEKHDQSGLLLSELKHTKSNKLAEHSHQHANFCLLLNGSYAEYWGSRSFKYRPMTVVFHPPQLTHRDEIGNEGGHFFNVELNEEWMNKLGDYSRIPERPVVFKGDLTWLTVKLFREFKSTPKPHSALAIEGLVMIMLAELGRGVCTDDRRAPRWLDQAVELLHAEFKTSFTVGFVASQVGVHPFHLARVFKRVHQQTIGDYIKNLRVNFACQELVKADADLASVALSSGFADQSHFTRVFKQMIGVTPGTYRGLNKN